MAREAAGYRSASAFAAAHGLGESTYRHHENGTRSLAIPSAQEYAKMLGVNWQDFYAEDPGEASSPRGTLKQPGRPREIPGAHEMPRDFPVHGTASCGPDGAFTFDHGQPIDFVRRPPRLRGIVDAYALYVQGSSMSPWREEGQIVYVHQKQPVQINDYVVVQVRDQEHPSAAYIKRLIRRNANGIVLLQYNPRKEIQIANKRVVAIHRIIDWSELLGV